MEKLKTENVCKSFGEKHVLKDISVKLESGEIVCLLGLSGAGKTTLFNIISGIMEPDSGKVLLNGEDITAKAGKISYMQQKDLLMPYRTILDNVCLPLILKGVKKRRAREEAGGYFKEFGIDGTQKLYPDELSGGMRQRAALLRTYLFSHEVALLDEPFSALDPLIRAKLQDELLDLQARLQRTSVFVSHDVDEAFKIGNRIALMEGGRLVQVGTAREIIANPVSDYVAEFVAHMNPLGVLTARDVMAAGGGGTGQAVEAETPVKVLMEMLQGGAADVTVTDKGQPIGHVKATDVLSKLLNPRG